jgi:hypothetical protein
MARRRGGRQAPIFDSDHDEPSTNAPSNEDAALTSEDTNAKSNNSRKRSRSGASEKAYNIEEYTRPKRLANKSAISNLVLFLKLIFLSSSTLETSLKDIGRVVARMYSLTAVLDDAILKTYETPGAEDLFTEYEYGSLCFFQVATILTSISLVALKAIHAMLDRYHHSVLSRILTTGTELIRTPLENGRRDAHNQNVRILKQRIASIYHLDDLPAEKSSWGFYYDRTAMLLRPINVEIDSTQWYVSVLNQNMSSFLLRKELRAGAILPPNDEWPAFTYAGQDGPTDPDDLSDGFLKDAALIKVSRAFSPHACSVFHVL